MLSIGHLEDQFNAITAYWSPRVIAIANGQYIKLAKVKGEFVWHAHADQDEFFLVYRGTFILRYRDGTEAVLEGRRFSCRLPGPRALPLRSRGSLAHSYRTGWHRAHRRCPE